MLSLELFDVVEKARFISLFVIKLSLEICQGLQQLLARTIKEPIKWSISRGGVNLAITYLQPTDRHVPGEEMMDHHAPFPTSERWREMFVYPFANNRERSCCNQSVPWRILTNQFVTYSIKYHLHYHKFLLCTAFLFKLATGVSASKEKLVRDSSKRYAPLSCEKSSSI